MADQDRLFDVAVIGSGLAGSTLGAILARQGHDMRDFYYDVGEGWHNTHHRFPARARIGESAWHIDISCWGIRLMELLGLAREVRR